MVTQRAPAAPALEAFLNVWVVRKGGHITAGFGADGISRIAHGASRRSRSAVALVRTISLQQRVHCEPDFLGRG